MQIKNLTTMLFAISFGCIVLFSSPNTRAAIPKNEAKKQALAFVDSGIFKGGRSGKGFSVLAFKRVESKSKKAERYIIDIGNMKGEKLEGTLGYFHAVLEKKPRRLSMDLMQTAFSKVDQKKLKKIFKDSNLVKRAKMNRNPEDGNLSLAFYFKKNVKARVYSVETKGLSPKLVIDVVAKK